MAIQCIELYAGQAMTPSNKPPVNVYVWADHEGPWGITSSALRRDENGQWWGRHNRRPYEDHQVVCWSDQLPDVVRNRHFAPRVEG